MPRKPTKRQQEIINLLDGFKWGFNKIPWAYNTCEICRILNGIEPRDFKGCFFDFSWETKSARCKHEARGCQYQSGSVDSSLRNMQKRGFCRSVKMRWFDGRAGGAAGEDSLQMDNFRFYYTSKQGLANKLKADIARVLE